MALSNALQGELGPAAITSAAGCSAIARWVQRKDSSGGALHLHRQQQSVAPACLQVLEHAVSESQPHECAFLPHTVPTKATGVVEANSSWQLLWRYCATDLQVLEHTLRLPVKALRVVVDGGDALIGVNHLGGEDATRGKLVGANRDRGCCCSSVSTTWGGQEGRTPGDGSVWQWM